MFETLFSRPSVITRHRKGPFAAERAAYLRQLADRGSAPSVIRRAAVVCMWVAERIRRWPPDRLVGDKELLRLSRCWARRRAVPRRRAIAIPSPKENFRSFAKGFLRVAGRLAAVPTRPAGPYEDRIQTFLTEQREERHLSVYTCDFRAKQVYRFAGYLTEQSLELKNLCPSNLDEYFQHLSGSWSRVSLHSAAVALRAWLKHCERKGYVRPGLAKAILVPQVYSLEGIPPLSPTWEEVTRAVAETEGTKPAALRARAALLLLAVYGIRGGELRRLRLEDIDWQRETISFVRSKCGRRDTFPLNLTVGNAIADYLRNGRPRSDSRLVFLTLIAPFRPLSKGALNSLTHTRLARVMSGRKGCSPRALRHASAHHLVDAGFTLKEIGDYLGHRSAEATRIYTKVDLPSLRLVVLEDLGGLV